MRFTHSSKVRTLQLVHTEKRPFKCSDVEKCFKITQDLLTHQRIHTGEPFTCPKCAKGFTNLSNLLRHQRVHKAKYFTKPE
uniref:gastrula zinc finger protein XlCGF71.1-like n=1 Tax=Pristiophorus japonicus TaxID=55135 RepID=UPI00398E7642